MAMRNSFQPAQYRISVATTNEIGASTRMPLTHPATCSGRDLRNADSEIAEIAWFSPLALPEAVTAPTRRRLAESLHGEPADPMW